MSLLLHAFIFLKIDFKPLLPHICLSRILFLTAVASDTVHKVNVPPIIPLGETQCHHLPILQFSITFRVLIMSQILCPFSPYKNP